MHVAVDKDNQERINQAEKEPNINHFDGCGDGQATTDRDVESRNNHHAGEVDGDNGVKVGFISKVVWDLIDDDHKQWREVSW